MSSARSFSIHSLPNELLVAIATAGQSEEEEEDDDDDDEDYLYILKPEWTLSQVSGRLRSVIVSAPTLWTRIDADLDAEGSVEILKLYLERSGTCSLWATLHHLTERDVPLEPLRLLALHIHRIWRLRIELDTHFENKLDWAPLRGIAAPNLRHLEITNGVNDSVYQDSAILIELFSLGAPSLTFVQIRGFIPFPVASWTASLTRLEFWGGQDAGSGIFLMTKQCPLLVHLHLDIRIFPEGERFHIPSLKSLHVSAWDGWGDSRLLDIFNLFDTPALTEFKIDHAHGARICRLFNSAHLASFPALTSLSFINSDPCPCETEPEPTAIISSPTQLFPALSSLALITTCSTENLVPALLDPHLGTFTLCSREEALPAVCIVVRDAVRSIHQRGLSLPKLRLSRDLFSLMSASGELEGMEIFDPTDVLDAFRYPL